MARIIHSISYLTADEAAETLQTTPTRILMLLKGKALDGMQVDGEWFVASDSVSCFKTHGKDLKIIKGCASSCTSSGCGCK